jgi:hypothetical protein
MILSSLPNASAEETAAIVAAIERFMRATAQATCPPPADPDEAWRQTALLESVARDDRDLAGSAHPWLRTPE